MSKKKYTVEFEVVFRTTVEVGEGESLAAIVSDLNIPEDDQTQYVPDTFDVISITDEQGAQIDPEIQRILLSKIIKR